VNTSTISIVAAFVLCAGLNAQKAKSSQPPVGPPWQTDFLAARTAALAAGKPIFLYSTKTY
tara:strand:+ start:64014 stop:64196 length:183 start_codon:yes stop_codon:yes gene_type:complete